MWGVIPAAGRGSRIQPLAFSKELLPVGSRTEEGVERPCAVSEYLVERMIRGGADKICFVISPGKSDILEYFGGQYGGARIAYLVNGCAATGIQAGESDVDVGTINGYRTAMTLLLTQRDRKPASPTCSPQMNAGSGQMELVNE